MIKLQNPNSDLAKFNWRGFARDVKAKFYREGRGFRPIATEIGVTNSDLNRAIGGQVIGPHKVITLCYRIGSDVHDYYIWPDCVSRPEGFTFGQLKQLETRHSHTSSSMKSQGL